MKKQGIAFWFNAIAIIAAIVALIGTIVSSNISTAYVLGSLGMIIGLTVAGIVLLAVAIAAPMKFGNHDFISTIALILAVAAIGFAFRELIMDRVFLIAAQFSYDAVNMTGWRVFYASAVGMGGYVVSAISLIIGSFLKSVK